MARSQTAYAADTEPIRPECLYPYNAFIRAAGLPKTRIREARLQGLVLPTIATGKRKYVRGVDGIAFIEALANLGSAVGLLLLCATLGS